MDGFRACNRYIDTQAPWKSRKTDMELCATTVHTCIQCTKTLGVSADAVSAVRGREDPGVDGLLGG